MDRTTQPDSNRLRVLKRALGKMVLAIASTAVGLVLMEYAVRWIYPIYDPRGMICFVRQNGVSLAPKDFAGRQWKNTGDYDVSVRINQYGFRDSKDLSQSTDEDLFVVGDSFSFGWGVEERERYSNLLESFLGRRVYNICVPTDIDGYDRLVAYAEDRGATIHNLLVAICIENDLREYEREETPTKGYLRAVKASLSGHSAVYNALTTIVHENDCLERVASRLGLAADECRTWDGHVSSMVAVESSVRRVIALLERHEIMNAIIVVIPSRRLWLGDTRQIHAMIHDRFVGLLRVHGLRVVDLRKPFEEAGAPLEYHFKNDGHWNARGHRQAAETIYRYLSDNGWPREEGTRSVEHRAPMAPGMKARAAGALWPEQASSR